MTERGYHERPVVLQSDGEQLVGLYTTPDRPRGVGVVVLAAGGYGVSAQRNRVMARSARALGAAGHHVVRFDYRGVGDSSGNTVGFPLDQPFMADARAAVDLVRVTAPETDVVLVGQCFGARTALAVAATDPGISGLVLVASPLRDHDRGEGTAHRLAHDATVREYAARAWRAFEPRALLDPHERRRYRRMLAAFVRARWMAGRSALARLRGHAPDVTPWVSRRFSNELGAVLDRGVHVLVIYGTDDSDYADWQAAAVGGLRPLLERGSDRLEVQVFAGRVHGANPVETQDELMASIHGWIERFGSPAAHS